MGTKVQLFAALAALMIVLSWASPSMADSVNSESNPDGAIYFVAFGSPVTEDSNAAPSPELPASNDWLVDTLQTFSPIPVLALGILGLFWVRRHTTEL